MGALENSTASDVRAWARANGHDDDSLGRRGALSRNLIALYDRAHPGKPYAARPTAYYDAAKTRIPRMRTALTAIDDHHRPAGERCCVDGEAWPCITAQLVRQAFNDPTDVPAVRALSPKEEGSQRGPQR